MKKLVELEATFCDGCKERTYVSPCLRCGIEHCWKCCKSLGTEYRYLCYGSGSGDGYYCRACDLILSQLNTPMHRAYRKIASLQQENELFYADWKQRCKDAEAHLARLQETDATKTN